MLSDEKLLDIYQKALDLREGWQIMAGLRAVAEAAVKDAVGGEPVAWEFQHEDTGLTMYECPQQVEWGFEKNNPRWKKIGPVYRRPQASAAVPDNVAKDAERYRWLKSRMVGVNFDWDDEGMTALAFEMPDNLSFCADCDKNIDSAMLAASQPEVRS